MKLTRALMLVLALSITSMAGDMGNGVSGPSPSPSPQPAQSTSAPATSANDMTADGDMGTGVADAVTETAVGLLQTLLALI